jgi:cell wall-associated NlpC family hydrolase
VIVTRAQVVEEARRWIGTPFAHQGRNRHGVDCIGLLVVVARELGLSQYDFGGYGRVPDGATILREAATQLEPVPIPERQPADIFVMRWTREPQHLGFISPRGVIHAWARHGGVVEVSLPDAWLRRFVACYRIPGVV